jgi:hypothetical protein
LGEHAVGEVELLELRPVRERVRERLGAAVGLVDVHCVVLQLEDAQARVLREGTGECSHPVLPDPVLRHAHVLQRAVCGERLSPCRCASVLETVPAADDDLEVALLARCLAELCGLEKCGGDDGASSRTEAVVVQLQDGEGAIVGEEGHHGIDGAASERVIRQVDLDERGLRLQRVADGGQCLRDLGDEAAGEDIRKVSNLTRCQSAPVSK